MAITASSTAPLIVVVGASGTQGSSVIRHLAQSAVAYRVRALTRNTASPTIRALATLGAQPFTVELGTGESGLESAKRAFEGADVAYAMTNMTPAEWEEGKALVDAAKAVGVKTYIFSGLPDFNKLSNGVYSRASHFDTKSLLTNYARTQLSADARVIEVQAPVYMQNFFNYQLPAWRPEAGHFEVCLPMKADAKVHRLDMDEDWGAFVVGALESKSGEARKVNGVEVVRAGSGDEVSFGEACEVISAVSGKKVVFKSDDPSSWEAARLAEGWGSLAGAVHDMWACIGEFGYFGKEKVTTLQELGAPAGAKPQTFKEWVDKSKAKWDELLVDA